MHVLLLAAATAYCQVLTWTATRRLDVGGPDSVLTFQPAVSGKLTGEVICGSQRYAIDLAIKPGQPVEVTLAGLGEGRHPCEGQVTLVAADDSEGTMSLVFEVVRRPQLGFRIQPDDVDQAARRAALHPSRPLARIEGDVIGERGVSLGEVASDLSDPANPTVSWGGEGDVLAIRLRAWDVDEFGATLQLSPWSYEIAHEDVIFDTNQATILPAEAHKLEATLAELQNVLQIYGDVAEVQLYVGGCTDTVGDAASNLRLSAARARAIAVWFRNRGFQRPIFAQGFGESALAVLTADEVDLAANRRAVYILAASPPPASPALPGTDWVAVR